MAIHSSVLAWRIPGTGEPGGLPCLGSHRVGHDWSDLAAAGPEYIVLKPVLLNTALYRLSTMLCLMVYAGLCLVAQSCLILCNPPGSSAHGDFPGKNTEWVATPSSRGSSQHRDPTQVYCITGGFFSEPAGKPQNTGVGSLSLLHGNFPTQK